ncbi:SPOR domain-containing protein [Maribacter sp. Asnod2-G09]|uniref:SPOR domain-containing protein n=1 Tax=Maribacter sp. Asnod2-G09 TaxID=3160577 RepID=UPI00386599F6
MTPDKDIFSSREGRWDFVIAIVVIAIFSAFIYMYMFNKEEDSSVSVTDVETLDETPLPASFHSEGREYVYSNSDVYEPITIPAKDAYDHNKSTAVVISDTTLTVSDFKEEINVDLEEEITTEVQSISKGASDESTSEEIIADIETPIIEKKETKTPVAKKVEQLQETTKTAPVATTNSSLNCIAMVGIFKDPNNKNTIIEKLKTLGYTHDEGAYPKGLIYVGVPVDCGNEAKRKQLILELNEAFGIDSWVKKR